MQDRSRADEGAERRLPRRLRLLEDNSAQGGEGTRGAQVGAGADEEAAAREGQRGEEVRTRGPQAQGECRCRPLATMRRDQICVTVLFIVGYFRLRLCAGPASSDPLLFSRLRMQIETATKVTFAAISFLKLKY